MDILKMKRLYKERGLLDYQLQTLDDAFFIHGINVNQVDGYGELSDKEKKMFKEFVVTYLNCRELEEREVSFLKVSFQLMDCLKVDVMERGIEFPVIVKR